MENLKWSAPEYSHNSERSNDWYWALAVVVLAGSATSIVYENYSFAVIIVLGGILMAYFASTEPGMTDYEINEKGLKMKNRIYEYSGIKAFWVAPNEDTLFIKSERLLAPVISVPIENKDKEKIRSIFLGREIKEEEMKEPASEAILEFFGF